MACPRKSATPSLRIMRTILHSLIARARPCRANPISTATTFVSEFPGVLDLEVWRAAQQIIRRYPEEPELAAYRRADAAWDAGNASRFQLWMRIAKAVRELV